MKSSILGVIRHILTTAGGYLTGQGLVSADELNMGVGAVVTLVGVVWSIWDKKDK